MEIVHKTNVICFNFEHLGFFFNSTTLTPTDKLTAYCEQNSPYWRIDSVDFKEIADISCMNPNKCRNIPAVADVLTNDFDNLSNDVGDTFNFICNSNRKGKLD